LRFTAQPSSRLESAATMRVPSVGFCLATSTIVASTGPFAGWRCGERLGLGVR
jgi:hypothetical protein